MALGHRRRATKADRTGTLQELLDCDDRWLRACAVFAARQSGVLTDELAFAAHSDADPLVRQAAAADTSVSMLPAGEMTTC